MQAPLICLLTSSRPSFYSNALDLLPEILQHFHPGRGERFLARLISTSLSSRCGGCRLRRFEADSERCLKTGWEHFGGGDKMQTTHVILHAAAVDGALL